MAENDLPELDPLLARAYRAERALVDPVEGAPERVLAGALARVAAPPRGPVLLRRASALVASAAVAGVVGYALGRRELPPAPPPPVPISVTVREPVPLPLIVPVVTPAPAPVQLKVQPRLAGPELNEPLLIDQARAALRRRLVDEAIAALRRHEQLYPEGQLVEEREVLFIEAELLRGERAAARARIERYRQRFPDGLLRQHVETLAR